MADLPNPDGRMTPNRKAAVVQAVNDNALTIAEALRRYALTTEELDTWRTQYRRHGIAGLSAHHAQRIAWHATGSAL